MSTTNGGYCSSGYQMERISDFLKHRYSHKDCLHATEVYCGLFNMNKAYRRPDPGWYDRILSGLDYQTQLRDDLLKLWESDEPRQSIL